MHQVAGGARGEGVTGPGGPGRAGVRPSVACRSLPGRHRRPPEPHAQTISVVGRAEEAPGGQWTPGEEKEPGRRGQRGGVRSAPDGGPQPARPPARRTNVVGGRRGSSRCPEEGGVWGGNVPVGAGGAGAEPRVAGRSAPGRRRRPGDWDGGGGRAGAGGGMGVECIRDGIHGHDRRQAVDVPPRAPVPCSRLLSPSCGVSALHRC